MGTLVMVHGNKSSDCSNTITRHPSSGYEFNSESSFIEHKGDITEYSYSNLRSSLWRKKVHRSRYPTSNTPTLNVWFEIVMLNWIP